MSEFKNFEETAQDGVKGHPVSMKGNRKSEIFVYGRVQNRSPTVSVYRHL